MEAGKSRFASKPLSDLAVEMAGFDSQMRLLNGNIYIFLNTLVI